MTVGEDKFYKTIVMGKIVKYFKSREEASKDIYCVRNAQIIEVSEREFLDATEKKNEYS